MELKEIIDGLKFTVDVCKCAIEILEQYTEDLQCEYDCGYNCGYADAMTERG